MNANHTSAPWLFNNVERKRNTHRNDVVWLIKVKLIHLLRLKLQIFTYVVVGLGFTLFFSGLIGWVGGASESPCLVRLFLFSVVLSMIAEIGGIISLNIVRLEVSSQRHKSALFEKNRYIMLACWYFNLIMPRSRSQLALITWFHNFINDLNWNVTIYVLYVLLFNIHRMVLGWYTTREPKHITVIFI